MKLRINPITQAIAIAATGSLLSAGQVLAQSSPVLEEVMVTATKRQESVQDIPISVGVVTGEMMETFSIGDITDIQNFVPGLQVQETFGGTAIRVRGLGSGITNLAFDSSVPIYIDDVYSGRSNTALSAMLDPARVEVARGPQGALFGKSTTAGAISITSARPTQEFEAQLKLGAEFEYGGYTASGYVSGPLSDNVRARAAVFFDDLDGWTENRVTGEDDGGKETAAARVSFEIDSGENTTWYAKFETGTKDGEGRNSQPVSGTVFPPVGPFLGFIANQDAEIAAGTLEFNADDVRGVSTGFPREDFSEYEWNNITLSVESEFAGHTVKVIANHNEYENTYFLDVDGYAAQVLNTYISDEYESDSLELRFLSPTDQMFEYIGGIWYQTTNVETQQFSPFGTAAPIPVKGNALPYPTGAIRRYDRDADAYSVYGQLTFNMSDKFRAILDLRYTDEDQDSNASTRNVAWQTLDNWETPTLDPRGGVGEYTFTQNRSDDSFDPSLRLQYNITDDAMVYAVYARGSKAGGTKANDGALAGVLAGVIAAEGDAWAQRLTGLPAATLTPEFIAANVINFQQGNTVFDFEDEEAEAYELGFKSTLADGAVFLNGSIFTTEYKNLQTSSYNGTNFVIGNAGQATIEGIELDLSWQATESLRVNAAVSYIDAEYDSYPGASCVIDENLLALNEDCSTGIGNRGDRSLEDQAGEPLERSPDIEFNVSALWNKQVSDNLMMKVAGSVYHSGDYFIQPTQEPYSKQDSYTKYDLRVALAAADESWEVAINGRNLGDERVISHAYRVFSRFNTLTRGRTVTLEGLIRF